MHALTSYITDACLQLCCRITCCNCPPFVAISTVNPVLVPIIPSASFPLELGTSLRNHSDHPVPLWLFLFIMATPSAKAAIAQELKKAMETCGVPPIICKFQLCKMEMFDLFSTTDYHRWTVKAEPLSTGFTYHDTILTISGVVTLLCCVTCIGLITTHFMNFTNPREQRQ